MTSLDVMERTREYVRENFLYARPDVLLGEDEHLLERGIIDSMGVVELMQFLQEHFGIEIADDELTERHFQSLRAIADFVLSKRAELTA
jgi:acyl carrier protein